MAQQVNLSELYDAYKREDEVVVVPAGTYTAEVIRASVRNGNKGQGIMPIYKIVDGPYAGKTMMAGQFTASEAGRSIFFRQMKGFGLDEDFFRLAGAQPDPMKYVADAIVGRVVTLQILVKPWQGQDRNNVAIGGITLVSAAQDPVAAGFAQPAVQPPPPPAPQPAAVAPVSAPATAPPVQVAAPPAAPSVAAPATPVAQPAAPTAAVPPMPPIPAPTGGAPF